MKLINGEGPMFPDIAIVGEAPGAEEEIQGRPFVGRSGKLVNKLLEELGIDRSKCYITNVVKFRPENNRTPTDEEIKEWSPSLFEELSKIHPKLIITLGSVATKALFCNFNIKITKVRGNVELFKRFAVLPTFHPSYCLRNPKETDKLRQDLKTALEYLKGK